MSFNFTWKIAFLGNEYLGSLYEKNKQRAVKKNNEIAFYSSFMVDLMKNKTRTFFLAKPLPLFSNFKEVTILQPVCKVLWCDKKTI